MALAPKLVIVTRRTALDELLVRFGTRDRARFYLERGGGDLAGYEAAHQAEHAARERLRAAVPAGVRTQWLDRELLPTFTFGRDDRIVVLGQDGLVVNAARYLDGQSMLAINPDPGRIDGVLLPFTIDGVRPALARVLDPNAACAEVTMAEARLADGQRVLAVNDLFIGHQSHGSARYTLTQGDRSEPQSSSGLIVSTGAGSTGWFRSILAGAAGIAEGFTGGNASGLDPLRTDYRFGWSERRLAYCVREPFTSRTSRADLIFGWIDADTPLSIESLMPRDGVIFSDGVAADYVPFLSGATATIGLADRTLRLVQPG